MPELICPKCNLLLRPKKVGVPAEMMSTDGPYKLYMGDCYACPKCEVEIIASIGTPLAEHYQPHYEAIRARIAECHPVTQFWATQKEQQIYCGRERGKQIDG